jgi:hypothetical protein
MPNGTMLMGVERANRMVRNGRAQWVTPQQAIRFTEADAKHQAIMQHARATAKGYDQRSVLSRSEIRRIPVLFPERLK